MLKVENYYEKPFTDLAKLYYQKFYKVFPVSLLKNMDNDTLKEKIVNSLVSGQVFNHNDEKFKVAVVDKKINYIKLIELIKESMDSISFDYTKMIKEINNIVDLRKTGKIFSFEEHLEALILSQLSNHRWGSNTIKKNKEKLKAIFKDYDKDYLKQINPNTLTQKILDINCGNASIYRQMKELGYNIAVLERIEEDYGSLDNFVSSDIPNTLANILYDGKYKLKQVGKAFALDYLKRVGINTCKTDSQVSRLFGNDRLCLINKNKTTALETVSLIKEIAKETSISEIEVDSLLWQFCLPRGANICVENPNCSYCKLKSSCNYNK